MDGAIEAVPPGASSVLAEGQRLSLSPLWQIQRRYYDRAGIDAWRAHGVPHYVTNNCAFARAYAAVFLGFLRDCAAASPPLDESEPLTIVEIGGGSGRFAYLFLKALGEMRRRSSVAGVRLRYVITDFTDRNVQYWRGHAKLRPFVEQGILDFAVFDAERDDAIHLLEANTTIAPGGLKNPLGVVANYVFDTIAQDAFVIEDGALHEYLLPSSEIAAKVEAGTDVPNDPLVLAGARSAAPISEYYGDAELDVILERYARSEIGGAFLFPHAAIRCVRRLADLAGGRLLLLSADYGDTQDASARWTPGLSRHGGCFSLPMNYHAMAEWTRVRGGRVFTTAHHHAHIAVTAFLLGQSFGDETQLAYEQSVEAAGPDDWCWVHQGVVGTAPHLSLGAVLSAIRMGHWDPEIVRACLPPLWSCLGGASVTVKKEVVRALVRAWENHYPMGEASDLAFEFGMLAHAYGAHAEALGMFADSLRVSGDDPRTRWNIGLCYWALGRFSEALASFGECTRVDPAFVPAGTLQIKEPPSPQNREPGGA